MLMSPIVITVEMNYLPSIFSSAAASGSLGGAPTELESAYFQVKQVHANDRGDLMVATADRSKAYSFPTKCFYQNEIQVPIAANETDINVQLTGFRNGQVRSIIFWVTDNAATNPTLGARFVRNFTDYILPRDVQLLYNGTVYYDAKDTAAQFWNLVSTETPSTLEATVLSLVTNDLVSTPASRSWVEVPFGQVYEQLSGSHMYVAGKTIQNAVVNLSFKLPANLASGGTLHAMYAYNCVIMCADGSAEYVF
jgi:hypothetical protein